MKNILEITVCQFCDCPSRISDIWASLHEQTELRQRWCSLLRENLREAILITGLQMDDFDKLYTYAVENLEDLSVEFEISSNTFEDFTSEWARVFATFYQETLWAYQRLYLDAMAQADSIRTVKEMGFEIDPLEKNLLDAADEKRAGDAETSL
jgi:hypothetical protein